VQPPALLEIAARYLRRNPGKRGERCQRRREEEHRQPADDERQQALSWTDGVEALDQELVENHRRAGDADTKCEHQRLVLPPEQSRAGRHGDGAHERQQQRRQIGEREISGQVAPPRQGP
jgi:hypothetical protein